VAPIREDYLLRLIRQIMAVLVRIAGLRRAGKLDEATEEIQTAKQNHFGALAELLPRLDPETAAHMLGSTERTLAWTALLQEEAELCDALRHTARGAALRQQAAALLAVARERAPEDTKRIEEAVQALAP
jgi:hypothetical protein